MRWLRSCSKRIPPSARNPPPKWLASCRRLPIGWLAPPPRSRFRPLYAIPAVALLLGLAAFYYLRFKAPGSQPPIPNNPSSYTQLTSFTDSACAPVLSPDGRMLAFYRSASSFGTPGQIWLKLLPDGEPVQLTHDPRYKYGISFFPGGDRIAYTVFPHYSPSF